MAELTVKIETITSSSPKPENVIENKIKVENDPLENENTHIDSVRDDNDNFQPSIVNDNVVGFSMKKKRNQWKGDSGKRFPLKMPYHCQHARTAQDSSRCLVN